jgi:hypothetical protein
VDAFSCVIPAHLSQQSRFPNHLYPNAGFTINIWLVAANGDPVLTSSFFSISGFINFIQFGRTEVE